MHYCFIENSFGQYKLIHPNVFTFFFDKKCFSILCWVVLRHTLCWDSASQCSLFFKLKKISAFKVACDQTSVGSNSSSVQTLVASNCLCSNFCAFEVTWVLEVLTSLTLIRPSHNEATSDQTILHDSDLWLDTFQKNLCAEKYLQTM